MITADTITDEQIRELRDEGSRDRDVYLFQLAERALGIMFARDDERPRLTALARGACAEILNRRACGFGLNGGECFACEIARSRP